jgi:hypothetical protein
MTNVFHILTIVSIRSRKILVIQSREVDGSGAMLNRGAVPPRIAGGFNPRKQRRPILFPGGEAPPTVIISLDGATALL